MLAVKRGISATNMDGRFRRYTQETHRPVRQVDVKEGRTLAKLTEAWKRFKYWNNQEQVLYENYHSVLWLIRKIEYNGKDLEKFCIALAEFQDEKNFAEKAGIFLSALIGNAKETNFVLDLNQLSGEILYFGLYLYDKNVTVNGNAGRHVGQWMNGGTLTVNGNVGNFLGECMRGGKIVVNGNTGNTIGQIMSGGEIHLNGEFGEIWMGFKGRIYHNGKLHLEKKHYG